MAIPGVRPRFLAPGDKLGKFELIRQIAVGGMAELYLARTMGIEGFEKLVVVKRILPQYADNQQFVSMFLNEARLSATLHHANIAQVYDIGVEDGDYFFSMEYIHGEDLGRLQATAIENGVPMSLDVALTLVAGLCAGLHYAHTKAGPDGRPLEVVHRDVSPSNVIVSYDGGVKLVDFGIARAGSTPSTTRGGLKGTIAYMSPEQCRGEARLDRRSDIFSIGTILYELTTGRLPFVEDNEYAVLNNIVNVDAPPPSTIVPSYSPALEAIVLKALARDPARRHASALELQKEIEDYAHENRLRISPLVLARLMSTLFPARLEEWDQARAQGAFFVEQHVVRTLVESGKTQVEPHLAQIPAAPVVPPPPPPLAVVGPSSDDEATDLVTALPAPRRPSSRDAEPAGRDDADNPFGDSRTLPGQGPQLVHTIPSPGRAPTPSPRASSPSPRASSPSPRASSPVLAAPGPAMRPTPPPPALSAIQDSATPAFGAPTAGTLISNPSADSTPVAAPAALDVTERVRVPRNDDTAFVRTDRKSRAPLVIALGLVLAGAGVAAFIAFGGHDATAPATPSPVAAPSPPRAPVIEPEHAAAPAPAPAASDDTAAPPAPTEPAAAAPAPEPTAAVDDTAPKATSDSAAAAAEPTETSDVAAPSPAKTASPAPAAPSPRPETRRPVTTKKAPAPKKPAKKPTAVVKKTEKAEPRPEPKKESEWNADSPFMPVRQ